MVAKQPGHTFGVFGDWGKNGLSLNTSITIEFIEKHIDEEWNWEQLSKLNLKNSNFETVEEYIDFKNGVIE